MSEIDYKSIIGWPYSIGNDGSVRRDTRVGKARIGAQLRPFRDSYGYAQVTLRDGGRRWDMLVHRLVSIYHLNWFGEVNHRDGNKFNNVVSNLEPTFREHQINHAWVNGLWQKGRKRRKGIHVGQDNLQ